MISFEWYFTQYLIVGHNSETKINVYEVGVEKSRLFQFCRLSQSLTFSDARDEVVIRIRTKWNAEVMKQNQTD